MAPRRPRAVRRTVTVRSSRPKRRRTAVKKVTTTTDWRGAAPARRAVTRIQNIVQGRGNLGSKYLAVLRDPLNADPAQIPDGYHAETTAVKLVSAGMIISTDNTGSATFAVDSRGFGGSMASPGTQVNFSYLSAGYNQATYQTSNNTPFLWCAPPSAYWTTNFNSSGNNGSIVRDGRMCWMGTGSTVADGASNGTPLAAQFFPGIDDFLGLYNQGRFVSGAVQLTYIGPHGDSQRGAVYVNASQIGFPDNGVSHFDTRAALRSHPETVKFPIGTSVTIPFYPSSVVGEGFVPLNSIHGLVGAGPDCIRRVAGADVNLISSPTVGDIPGNTIVYPFTTTADRNTNTWGSKNLASSDLYALVAVPLTARTSAGSDFSSSYPEAGTFSTITQDHMLARNACATGILNQLPVVYFNIEGATTTVTGIYDVKVVLNVEAIVRPSAASFIGATEVPHVPSAILAGKTMMETLGDLGSTIGSSILSAAAPYASELGKVLARKGGEMVLRRF